jgi:hypothetical protein
MYEVTEEMLAEEYRSSIFAKPRNDFCCRCLEERCDPDDLALMKVLRAWFWGPGPVMSETDYLTMTLGHAPSREEVQALIDRGSRLLEPCFEAWCESTERSELWLLHKKRLLLEHDAAHPGYAKAWSELRERVLRHGGSEVVPPRSPDPLIELLVEQGAVVAESTGCVFDRGERPDCHVNAVALWRGSDEIAIGTGYALSPDSIWRQHSWAWDRDGRLIETTETQTRYFGVRMNGPQTEWFANRIAPTSVDGSA